jgi:hypothetical protein
MLPRPRADTGFCLEKDDVQADPTTPSGKADMAELDPFNLSMLYAALSGALFLKKKVVPIALRAATEIGGALLLSPSIRTATRRHL